MYANWRARCLSLGLASGLAILLQRSLLVDAVTPRFLVQSQENLGDRINIAFG